MSRNGSGVYNLPAGNPVVTGTTISSTWANTTLSDIATALTGSVAADGQTAMTGNLQMANNKITGLAVATASGDALSYGQAATISALTVSGAFAANGGATLGDASGDALTINSSAVSAPNGLNFNSNALVLNTSGNLGLGVAPSAWDSLIKVVEGNNGARIGFQTNSTSVLYMGANNYYNGGAFKYTVTGQQATDYRQFSGSHSWYTSPTGTAGNAITFTQAMTLDASGNLGVGNTSPSTSLVGSKGIAVNGASSGDVQLRLQNNNTGTTGSDGILLSLASDNGGYLWNYENSYFVFGTNSSERMRIASNGRVGINTTTHLWDQSERLSVVAGTIDAIAAWKSTQATGQHIFLNNAGSLAGYITWTGTTTTYITSSDYRLKENIAPMTGALDKVALLKPCTYTWKADGSTGDGFIAHELAEVCPSAVSGEKDAVREDGSIKPQGIDTSFLVATLTAAIQELKAIVDAQAARITALEAK